MTSFLPSFVGMMTIWVIPLAMQDTPAVKVLVLDALNGKPQVGAQVYYLCDEIPHETHAYAVTDSAGMAQVPYMCDAGKKRELDAIPQGNKEGCGSGASATLDEIEFVGVISNPSSAGGVWCPTKVSKKLKAVPGQVVLFVKKPTWWQAHVAG
jgi:hypothetical protein